MIKLHLFYGFVTDQDIFEYCTTEDDESDIIISGTGHYDNDRHFIALKKYYIKFDDVLFNPIKIKDINLLDPFFTEIEILKDFCEKNGFEYQTPQWILSIEETEGW